MGERRGKADLGRRTLGPAPRPGRRYSLVVGLLFAIVILIALLNTIEHRDEGTLGIDAQPPRWPLPEFAVPVAAGSLEGDANIAQDDCGTSQIPCPEDARRTPACRVRAPHVIRVCDLFDRPLVISFWFMKGAGGCVEEQDVVNAVYERYRGRVRFLSLDIGDDRGDVREAIRERGWKMPVGYDRDGAVAGLYRVGGCPTYAFAYPGGTLQSSTFGELDEAALSERVRALLRATRAAQRQALAAPGGR